jgi:TPR repeat protein
MMNLDDFSRGGRRLAVSFLLLLPVPQAGYATDDVMASLKAFHEKMAEKYGNMEAHIKLAEMFEHGGDTEKDLEKAIQWYEDALIHGYEPAREKIEKLRQLQQQRAEAEESAGR